MRRPRTAAPSLAAILAFLAIFVLAAAGCGDASSSSAASTHADATATSAMPSPTLTSKTSPTPAVTGTIQLGTAIDVNFPNGQLTFTITQPTTTFTPSEDFFALITLKGTSQAESISFSFTDQQGRVLYSWQQWLALHYGTGPNPDQIETFPGTLGASSLGAVLPPGTPAGTYLMTVSLQDAQITPARFTYTDS